METFDVQTIEIHAPAHKSFAYIADSRNLPDWTSAFQSVSCDRARMATPQGAVDVELKVTADLRYRLHARMPGQRSHRGRS